MKDIHIIGWRERIDLPKWGIKDLLAKSDTGANSSAIDVAWLEELPDDRVRFGVRKSRKNSQAVTVVESDIVRRTRIRSSNGERAHRIFVTTRLKVGSVKKDVEFGLVCRKQMMCRVLLGRRALEGDFLVDCSERHVQSTPKPKKKKTKSKAKAKTKSKAVVKKSVVKKAPVEKAVAKTTANTTAELPA